MAASLVARRQGVSQPRLEFRTVQTAAQTALRFAEGGLAIPAIVNERGELIWDYPGGDPTAEPARQAIARLRLLASSP